MLTKIVIIALVALSSAECPRNTLITARDAFFAKKSDVVASNALIGFNNQKKTTLAETPYANLGPWTDFLVQAVDSETCNIATFRVSENQLLSVRLAVNPAGQITEVDFLQAVKGDQFFRPSGFPETAPAIFTTKQKAGNPPKIPAAFNPAGVPSVPQASVNKAQCKAGTSEARTLSRKELVYVASTYCDGLKGAPWDSCVVGGDSCPRNENGVTTTKNCAVGTGVFGFTVRGRRWVADVETGVVLGIFYFDYKTASNLFLHEYFKIDAGKLAHIYAPMKNIPKAQAHATIFTGPDGPEPQS